MPLQFAGMDFTCVLDSLEKYQIPEKDCLLPLLSKSLGYAIVCGSVFLKVPQIYLILASKSIKGLSVPSFELEVAGFTIALAYCLFKQLPFSAYGELVFILLQSLICLALIYYYSPHRGKGVWIKSALYSSLFLYSTWMWFKVIDFINLHWRYCALAPTLLAGKLDATLFEALYACQHAIFFFARLPQIWENFQTKNTGQLSFLTNFMATGGCVVRTFTSIQEQAPVSMLVGSLLGLLTNGIVCAQIIAYQPPPKKVKKLE